MTQQFIPFSVDTSRILELLAKQIYQSPLALLRENTQNAFDATLLRAQREPGYEPKIEIEVGTEKIVVRDNGIGMTADDLRQHFWQAGSSSKNTEEARRAGVVGTFGIGAMANFGIAEILEVTTESAINGQRTSCVAKREELQFNQDCIAVEVLPPTGQVGTEIVAKVPPGTQIDVNSVRAYVSDFVAFLQTTVTFNSELVSRQPIEKAVQPVAAVWSHDMQAEPLSARLTADVSVRISANGDIGLNLESMVWNGSALEGRLLLRSGVSSIRTFRSGFGLATTSVDSAYQFGGIADIRAFQPTAGREALTTDSMQLLQSLMADIDNFASLTFSKRPECDSSTPFMQWVVSHGRYDLCEHLKVTIHPGERTTLADIRARCAVQEMPVYDGVDPAVIASFSSEDRPLIQLARSNPRKQCENGFLKRFCKTSPVSNAPRITSTKKSNELSFAEAALAFRIEAVIESDYFLRAVVGFGTISHGLSMLVEFKNDAEAIITLDPAGSTVAAVLGLHRHDYPAFGSMVKDFIRNAIFPKISDKVPSSTRQGAEAFLRSIRKPREIFEYEDTDTSQLSSIWGDYSDGLITLAEAVGRSKKAVNNYVQTFDGRSAKSVAEVIPDVVPNEQATHLPTDGDTAESFEAAPAITRSEVLSGSTKLLTIPADQPDLRGFRCFVALSEKIRSDMGEFFLQPHKTSIVWGGQKVLFIFMHHSGEIGLYYDLQTRDSISENAGGGSFQTSTIVLKDAIYIPVPKAIESSFIPVAAERKRFEIRADILRVDGNLST
ncbi:ATP-binding protein [Acidovorax sp.]|uniref:ATP-binding protein n=1 Tax=Acidovorax sp. TaxID=1872122 RepID=UPI003D045DEB